MCQIDSENIEVLNEEFVRALAWGRGGVGVSVLDSRVRVGGSGVRVGLLRLGVEGLRVEEPGSG